VEETAPDSRQPARIPSPSPTPTPAPSPSPTSWPTRRLPDDFELALVGVAKGLDQPVFVTAPAGDPRLFVVEKAGRLRIIQNGRLVPKPFLDVHRKVLAGGPTSEQGMFALAFHPDYASNGRFFVHFTARPDGDTRVQEYRVSASDPNRADAATRRTILRVNQPFRWHNGGMMMFGPDGMLWLGLGDGGVKNDPHDHGQNPRTLLGSILRFDVDRRQHGKNYGIPPDNPFADGEDGAPEVWAYGLRNPWRFDIDPRRNLVYMPTSGSTGSKRSTSSTSTSRDATSGGLFGKATTASSGGTPTARRRASSIRW
jgi:glucose/arabinose dehydrogenase